MSDDEEAIDVEILIGLIRDQPSIWDRTREDYKHRDKKRDAWYSVCGQLYRNFQDLNEWQKRDCNRLAMKKWNNIRDHWIKWKNRVRMAKKSGVRAAKVRKYLYHEELTFLERGAWLKPINCCKNSFVKDTNQHTQDNPRLVSRLRNNNTAKVTPRQPTATLQRNRCSSELEQQILKVIESKEQENRHMQFFRSILPTLKKFNEDQILDFQMGVLHVTRNVQSSLQQQFGPPQNVYPYYSQDIPKAPLSKTSDNDQSDPSSSTPPDMKCIITEDVKCVASEIEESPNHPI